MRVVVAINAAARTQEATALQASSIGKYFCTPTCKELKEFIIPVTLDMHYSVSKKANLHRQVFSQDPAHGFLA